MQFGRIFGITLRIDWSWLIVFGLMTWSLSGAPGPFAHLPERTRIVTAAIAVLLLFACVIAHELAHALTARRFGIDTASITLFVFGGVSSLRSEPNSPRAEALISLAGPLTSFVLALIFFAVASVVRVGDAAATAMLYLAFVNALLGAFNLLPAYPLDGSHVFHAIVWHVNKNRARATGFTAGMTRAVGGAFVLFGILQLAGGYLVSGVWLELLAWFMLRAGQAEWQYEMILRPMQAMRVVDVADPVGASLPLKANCQAALDRMIATQHRALPVVSNDELSGMVTLADFAKLDGRALDDAAVTSIMTRAADLVSVAASEPAFAAFQKLANSSHSQLPVLDEHAHLVGFVTRDTVIRSLLFAREQQMLGPISRR